MKKPQQKLTHFLAETKKTHPLIQVYRLIIRLNLQHQKSESQKTRQKADILDRKNVMILVLSLQHQPPTFRYSINKSTLDWNCDPSTRFSNSQTLSMSTVFCFSSETINEIKKGLGLKKENKLHRVKPHPSLCCSHLLGSIEMHMNRNLENFLVCLPTQGIKMRTQ